MKKLTILLVLVSIIVLPASGSQWKEFLKGHKYAAFLNLGMTKIDTLGYNEILRDKGLPELQGEQMTVGLSGYVVPNGNLITGLSGDLFFNQEMFGGNQNQFIGGDLTFELGYLATNAPSFRAYPFVGLGIAGYAMNTQPNATSPNESVSPAGMGNALGIADDRDFSEYIDGDWEGAGGFISKAGIGIEGALPISVKFMPAVGIRAGYMWPVFKNNIRYTDASGLEQTETGPKLRGYFITFNIGLIG